MSAPAATLAQSATSNPPRRAPVAAGKPTPWILGKWFDLVLFVGTPAVLIPLFTLAQKRWSAQDIFLFVGAFGAMGHHLPGMIRAYGDKTLFHRFKVRFIFAPLVLLLVCVWSSFYNIQAIQLVALAWGIWHGLMQTYGFCRIYDSKSSANAAARARADFGSVSLGSLEEFLYRRCDSVALSIFTTKAAARLSRPGLSWLSEAARF